MVAVELSNDQIMGLLAFSYMGLTHNYENVEDPEIKKDRQLLYMTSVVTLQGMSEEQYKAAVDKLEELRQLIAPAPAETPSTAEAQ